MLFKYREVLLLLVLIAAFIAVRSLNYATSFDFSSDQGAFAVKAYTLFQNREFTLIGPTTSINYDDRQIFQGSVIYYFLLVFLLLGQLDPINSSYIFMLFCALMIVPLFIGVKLLINKHAAWFVIIIYCFLPLFIDHTKFLWNPNFQLSLSPLLILMMGLYKKKPDNFRLFFIGVLAGLLLMFHYQFIIVMIGLTIFYAITQKKKRLFFIIGGYLLGFFPILFFELRNNFYNFNTLIFYWQNLDAVLANQKGAGAHAHYYLSIVLCVFIVIAYYLRTWLTKMKLIIIGLVIFGFSLAMYFPEPSRGFGMSEGWNYKKEEEIFELIKAQGLQSFNVTNLIYDSKANVQRYLILKEGIDYEEYSYQNQYLFVISPVGKDIAADPAFEITSMKPFSLVNSWRINDLYSLFLVKRDDSVKQ